MQDPLSINIGLKGVDTTIPLLPEGEYPLQVVEATVEPNKAQTGHNLKLKLATTQPHTSVDGHPVNPNFPVFAQYALQPREDSNDPEAFKKQLGQVIDAVFNTTIDNRPDLTVDTIQQMKGRTVIARLVIEEYQGTKSNKVKKLRANA